jgi:hypothetical protein
MTSLQRQVGLFAIPLLSLSIACKSNLPEPNRFPRIQPARNQPVGGCVISVGLAFPQPLAKPGQGTPPSGPLPWRASKGPRIMTPDESEQAARPRAQAYRTRMRAERDRQIIGSHGPASPCKRIDPRTGEVIEVIAPSTKTPARRIR